MNDYCPWIRYRNDEIIVDTNIVLFFWTIGIVIGSITMTSKKAKHRALSKSLNCSIEFKSVVIAVGIAIAIMLWRVKNVGFFNLLFRGTSSYSISDNSSISLLISNIMQAMTYFSTVITIQAYKKKETGVIPFLICVRCLVVSYPPTGISRYATAIYMWIMLTLFDLLKKNYLFIFILLGGFSFVLPLVNAFRNVAFEQVNLSNVGSRIVDYFSTMWLAGDYYAYTMLTLVIDAVSHHGCTWMRQLLGVVLFWVPRGLWKNKPTGSGYYVAEQLGWSFMNISCPLPGAAYINLGFVGVIVFSILIGRLIKYIDVLYWNNHNDEIWRINLIYPVTMFFFFFMSRGDLLSSTAYMTAYVVVGLFLQQSKNIVWFNLK